MPRQHFQQELDALRLDVRAMGDTVIERLDDGLRAIERGDEAVAREVIDGDGEINRRYLDLEGDCVDLIALQQPVAGDLRFVVASFKALTDLERIGDLATNLGQYAIAAGRPDAFEGDVVEIGREARSMLEDALEAYGSGDAEACRRIAVRDDQVDARCLTTSEGVIRELVEHEIDGGGAADIEASLDDASRVLLAIRDLERVADHAVNIAARTLYMVENDDELLY